ncbi:unnamed protein product [Lactuca virosa]|uniref:Uncharacterized protein n=1 Tax=Lactuca virosa TaxID=75947 RepID=A0AAU9NKD3_9ASTR|nr:unnamed protein product [Lactuca virosa]
MAGMIPHWNRLSKKPLEGFKGKDVTLLDRLHRRWIANSTLMTEEVMASDSPTRSESSMDSALDVSRVEGSRPIPPNLHSKGMKLDSNFAKPPMVFTRATSKGFILKNRSESAQDDQMIRMFPPNQKRSSRELKSRSLNDVFAPPAPDAISSERTSEDPVTIVFHECPIEPDNEMKRVEDEAEVPHSDKPKVETVTVGLREKVPEDPPLEKENPKVLSAAVVFQ